MLSSTAALPCGLLPGLRAIDMTATERMLFGLMLLISVDAVVAGTFYRCDDGSRTPIYQTVPCGPDARTLAKHVYTDPVPQERAPRNDAAGPRQRTAPASRQSSPRATRVGAQRKQGIAAYACALEGEQWTQSQPCAADDSPKRARNASGAKPRQRGLTRSEVCRQVREGSYRGARGERAADSTYRRNLLRDRGGC